MFPFCAVKIFSAHYLLTNILKCLIKQNKLLRDEIRLAQLDKTLIYSVFLLLLFILGVKFHCQINISFHDRR